MTCTQNPATTLPQSHMTERHDVTMSIFNTKIGQARRRLLDCVSCQNEDTGQAAAIVIFK